MVVARKKFNYYQVNLGILLYFLIISNGFVNSNSYCFLHLVISSIIDFISNVMLCHFAFILVFAVILSRFTIIHHSKFYLFLITNQQIFTIILVLCIVIILFHMLHFNIIKLFLQIYNFFFYLII